MEKINMRDNEPVSDFRISVTTGEDGVIKTVFVNDQEFEPARDDNVIWTADAESGWVVELANKDFADCDIQTALINGVEFEPARSHGSIHTRLNQMDDKIEKIYRRHETTTIKNKGQYGGSVDTWLVCDDCLKNIIILNQDISYCPYCGRKIVR